MTENAEYRKNRKFNRGFGLIIAIILIVIGSVLCVSGIWFGNGVYALGLLIAFTGVLLSGILWGTEVEKK